MLQKNSKLFRTGNESSRGGNCLGQRTRPDADLTGCNTEVFSHAAAMGSQPSCGMRVIYQQEAAEFLLDLDDLRQKANVAVHGENAIGNNECAVGRRPVLDLLLERLHIVVQEALQLDSGKSTGVCQASMTERIHNDTVRGPQERPDHGEVGSIA